jgi:hypothetical protein
VGVVGFLSIGMGVNNSGLGKGLKQSEAMLGSFSARVEGLGKWIGAIGAGLGVAKIAGVITEIAQAGSDLNEQTSKVGVVFGESASTVTSAAQEMADKFGLVKTEFLDGAGSIGLVAKASGLTQKEAASLGAEFTKLAADVSSFQNVPFEEALAAIRSGLVGEAEPLRRFGVLLSDAAMKAEAARLGIAAMGGELTEAQKVQARVSLIRQGLADAQGDLARTAGGVANLGRSITGRVENLKADIGSAMTSVSQSILVGLGAALEKVSGLIAGNTDGMKSWAATAVQEGGLIFTVVEMVGRGIATVADSIRWLNFGFRLVRTGATGVFLAIAKAIDVVAKGIDKIINAMGGESSLATFTTAWVDELNASIKSQAEEFNKLWDSAMPSEKVGKFFDELKKKMAEAGKAQAAAGLDKPPAVVAAAAGKAKAGPLPGGLDLFGAGALLTQIQAISKTIDLQALAAPKLAGAVQLGSTEARSSVLRNQGVGTDVQKKALTAQQGAHQELKKANQALEKIAKGQAGGPLGVALF